MTLFPIEPAHFDFDTDRAELWPLPVPRAWNECKPALTRWERIKALFSAADDTVVGCGID